MNLLIKQGMCFLHVKSVLHLEVILKRLSHLGLNVFSAIPGMSAIWVSTIGRFHCIKTCDLHE